MQVFLPFPDVQKSLQVLDKVRLWKQVLEAKQLLDCIEGRKEGWKNHPCAKMYKRYPKFLISYFNEGLRQWKQVGKSSFEYIPFDMSEHDIPDWFKDEAFHLSHRSNLLRKALNDASGIGASGLPKKPSIQLLQNLERLGVTIQNTPENLEYVWPV